MTRLFVYVGALVAIATATAMAFAAVSVPRWISFSMPSSHGSAPLEQRIGLRHLCSIVDGVQTCRPYPDAGMCASVEGAGACALWHVVRLLSPLAAIVHLAALVAVLIVAGGGKYQRQRQWLSACGVLLVAALIQSAVMAMVAYQFDNDDQFLVPGWHLDSSWYLCTASATISTVTAIGLAVSACMLPLESGYEFLKEPWIP